MLKAIKTKDTQKGLTLIEVLVSLTILSILIIFFLPIMTGNFLRIIMAGKNSHNLFQAQSIMETRINDETAFKGAKLPIVVEKSGVVVYNRTISGGIVEADQLKTFIPFIPTAELEPRIVDEGYSLGEGTINVTGENTNFKAGSSTIKISNDTGYSYSPSLTVASTTKASFNLPSGVNRLTNAGSEYIITITTGNEVVRGKIKVRLPYFVTINGSHLDGNKSLEVSRSILYRENSKLNIGKITNLFWENQRFIAVGKHSSTEEGILYIMEEGYDWTPKSTGVYQKLNGLAYNGQKFVVVGDRGTIITSDDGNHWTPVSGSRIPNEASNRNLNAVSWGSILGEDGTTTEYFIAVGDKYIDTPPAGSNPDHDFGIILISKDGLEWNKVDFPIKASTGDISLDAFDYRNLKAVTHSSDKFIAVGERGSILILSMNNSNLEVSSLKTTITSDLNAIIFANNRFVTVGNNGTIKICEDGKANNWDDWFSPTIVSGSNKNRAMYDITGNGMLDSQKFTAVGDRVIATSPDGINWSLKDITGNILWGIVARE
ncbi:MAG: type II secretion system protein [Thermotaleaceae bacterium]